MWGRLGVFGDFYNEAAWQVWKDDKNAGESPSFSAAY